MTFGQVGKVLVVQVFDVGQDLVARPDITGISSRFMRQSDKDHAFSSVEKEDHYIGLVRSYFLDSKTSEPSRSGYEGD